jgi:phytoene dehydrogenase-like protein
VTTKRYDTIVIGAGMSGLAAGIRLAQFDRRVLILERHALWGGLNSFYTKAGRPFDVGLHALTNYVPPRTKGAPLTKILRQLRIRHEELQLGPHRQSELVFPGVRLKFTNDFSFFESEVEREFPAQMDGFQRIVELVKGHELREDNVTDVSARAVLAEHISDPLLIEFLMLPICFYGSAREDDCDWNQFAILFQSILLEGLSRPEGGIRPVLNLLIKRYRGLGGEVRTRSGVAQIKTDAGRVVGVVLDSGEELECDTLLSSAGWVETARMVDDANVGASIDPGDIGRLSFVESISVLDRMAGTLGFDCATSFYCLEDRLRYRRPEALIDVNSGVLSCPENFEAQRPQKEGMVRQTVLAHHDKWKALKDQGPEVYGAAKAKASADAIAATRSIYSDWNPHTIFRDVFTPTTVVDYTGHIDGSIYGSPAKRMTGKTPIEGLVLCGTDQGYLGVVGAMLSGIAMANRHALVPSA